jgi:hypothetical protein
VLTATAVRRWHAVPIFELVERRYASKQKLVVWGSVGKEKKIVEIEDVY